MERPKNVQNRTKQQIIKKAMVDKQSAITNQRELKLKVGVQRVQQILRDTAHIVYVKKKQTFFMTEDHKKSLRLG